MMSVPPPLRGWPLYVIPPVMAIRASPAHAGIAGLVPPPTRGWSLEIDVRLRRDGGAPAHAGMVPR
jgi:hypothetical protein